MPNPEKYKKHAAKALETFLSLGPAFIKLGQLLSVRPDVLPQPYIDEFAKLQDEVPPAPFETAKKVIEEDLGPIDKVFESFKPEAVTGASLGQVYQAAYKGKEVVVKVNRPGIKEQIVLDAIVLRRLVPLVGRFIDPSLRFSAQSIVDQFADTVEEEVDYKIEASNLLAIKKNLKGDKTVVIPELYPEVSTTRVLVLERITGIKINDVKALDAAGLDRNKLARRVSRIFFKMLLSQEIFHADPHPGNISVLPDGRIVLYDYGMTGKLDTESRTKLVRFYTALVDENSAKIVDVMIELGILQPNTNRYVIRKGVDLAIADMQGKKVEETEIRALMEIANRTIYQFPFKLPRNLVLYMRMLSILEGVVLTLDENFRFIHILGSLLEREGLIEEAYKEEIKDTLKRLGESLDAAVDLAPMLKKYLEDQEMQETNLHNNKGRSRSFANGALAGLGASALFVSVFFLGNNYGKLGLAASIIVLIVAVARSR